LIAGASSNIAVEIYGREGSLRWNIVDPHSLSFADARKADSEQSWQRIAAEQDHERALRPGVTIPVEGISFDTVAFADFLHKTHTGQAYDPGLEQGLRVQELLEMAAEANQAGMWVTRSRG
jgi:predicted dehydrogenase